MTQDLRFDGDNIWKELPQQTGEKVFLFAKEVRPERTGLHAFIGIFLNKGLLGNDTFNVGRSEERARLVKAAHRKMGAVDKSCLPLEALEHELDIFCLQIGQTWHKRFKIETLVGEADFRLNFFVNPYLIEGAATIIFAPPGSGKSYIGLLMTQSLNQGVTKLWSVQRRRGLYINIERSAASMQYRLAGVNQALGLPQDTPMDFINARGRGLSDIRRAVSEACLEHSYEFIWLDSISRAGQGSLSDDEVANKTIDILNGTSKTWAALGHTSKSNDDRLFGSVHYEAGEDIGIKLASQPKGEVLGISLQVTKANDIGHVPAEYLKLTFAPNNGPLVNAEKASVSEFPQLAMGRQMSRIEKLADYVKTVGKTTATEAADALGLDRGDVADIFIKSGMFTKVEKEGRNVYYGLLDNNR